MEKQTAGRDALNDFAPKFAELNDDVLFGEVWAREDLLYTGVTRAKKILVLVGEKKAITCAIRNETTSERNTRLAQRLAS